MNRLYQTTLIVSILILTWLGMQIVHELGHVLGAWIGGERVERVVLHPLVISRTDTSHDRHPLMVVWSGPIVGSLLPLVLMVVTRLIGRRLFFLFRFFAGFCLIANGVYLGVGSFGRVGAAGDLLRFGAPGWTLIVFGLDCVPFGLFLWNGLGPEFGMDKAGGEVDRRAALGTLGVLLILVLIEILAGSR